MNDKKITKISGSHKETSKLGKEFSKILEAGDVVVLEGDLGAGKTTFVKGVLKEMGVRERVLSPTFVLMRQYNARGVCLYHLDLYRLEKAEFSDLGMEDFIYSDKSITLIEWGGKVAGDLDKYIKIDFLFLNENTRKLEFQVKGYGLDKYLPLKGLGEDGKLKEAGQT